MNVFKTLLFFVATSFIAAPLTVHAEGWKAGTAKVKITPTKPVWMAGYASRTRPAEGTRLDLWAKTLVIEDGSSQRAVLITLDLVGISRGLSVAVCNELIEKHQFERKDIAICVSHTHTGPRVGRNLESMHYRLFDDNHKKLVDEYADFLKASIVKSVGEAIDSLEPCELKQGMGNASFAVNRRENRPESDVPKQRVAGTLNGPVNHDVPVLAVRHSSGKLKAVVFGYACHATVLSDYQWSGDYPGYAQAEIERLYPNCQAMFWAGCGADQNPLPRRTPELAAHYGRRLATAVEAVLLTTEMADVGDALATNYHEIDLELGELPTKEDLESAAKSKNRFEQSRARLLLSKLAAEKTLAQTYPYPVAVWRLGDNVRWAFLGGEVVVDYVNRLQAESDGPLWVAGYSNDIMAYIPSRRVLTEGGYEGATSMVYYGLPTSWSPTIENAIVNEVLRQAAVE
ncbi:MAG: neutral/alkaline non-lysosomal ceramidase N-terminal domain-containing protein [bacterium]|nr:neutral/alkaline non-lysosomal ceramidase N-terminal domain-containing protein [bacterium]